MPEKVNGRRHQNLSLLMLKKKMKTNFGIPPMGNGGKDGLTVSKTATRK